MRQSAAQYAVFRMHAVRLAAICLHMAPNRTPFCLLDCVRNGRDRRQRKLQHCGEQVAEPEDERTGHDAHDTR